jgi:DNA-binding transcriptional LysR family regulator
MNTMQVRCFLTAARYLNFTDSAAELFISQPALSHNISALEDELGIKLFIRDKKNKNTRLSAAGEIVYEGLKDLQGQLELLVKRAQNTQEGKSGILRIGLISSNSIDEYTLSIIDNFQEKYSDVDLTLRRGSNNELVQWLHNQTLDLAFALKIEVENKNWLMMKRLYSVESVLILSAKHPLAKKKDLSLIDFKDETFVTLSPNESYAIHSLLKQECERAGFTPKVIEAPDLNSQALYLESGKGIAIGSINNTAVLNNLTTILRLRELKPMELVIASNRANDNPCIELFHSYYENVEPLGESL